MNVLKLSSRPVFFLSVLALLLSRVVLALGRAADRVVGGVAALEHPQEAAHREDCPPVPVKDALVQRVPEGLAIVNDIYYCGR